MDVRLRIRRLLSALQLANISAQTAVEAELVEIGPAAVAPLVEAALGSDSGAGYQAARMLVRIAAEAPDPRLVAPICEVLRSPYTMVRQMAAQALGILGDGRAVLPLVEMLKDEKPLVQLWAAESLAKLGDPDAVAPLVEALRSTDSPTVRHTIIRILGGMGDPELIPVIVAYANDKDHHVRARVRDAVQQLSKGRADS